MTRTQFRAAHRLVRENGRTAFRWMDDRQQRVMSRFLAQLPDRLSDREDDRLYFTFYGVSPLEALRNDYTRRGYFDAADLRKL